MKIRVNELKQNELNEKIYGKTEVSVLGEGTSLVEQIKSSNYVKPILVKPDNTIISGHRRVAACKVIGIEFIEAEVISGKTELEYEELFLLENAARVKNTEQITNEYSMYKEIERKKANLRQKELNNKESLVVKKDTSEVGKARDIAAKKVGMNSGSKLDDNVKTLNSINKLDEESKVDIKKVFNSNIVASKKIIDLPEEKRKEVIANIKSVKPLEKIKTCDVEAAIKKVDLKDRTEQAKTLPKNDKVLHGDSVTMLKTLADKSVDCVVTDPPYGVEYKDTREVGLMQYKDGKDYALELLDNTCKELKRVCKEGAHLYFFTGFVNMFEFRETLKKYFHVQVNPIVWVKNNHTLCDFKKRYASKCEYIWFCHNSEEPIRNLNNDCSPDVISFAVESGKQHSAQKPIALLEYLIKNSTVANETVLDSFAGSGSTLVAAKKSNRNYIGIELEEEFVTIINERLI